MHALIDDYRIRQHPSCTNRIGTNPVLAGIVEHIVRCDEQRHIHPRLMRQIGIDTPKVAFATGIRDGFPDSPGTAIIGCDGQIPVAEDIVQRLQERTGRFSGFIYIESLVHQRVDLQSVALGRDRHELPQSCSTRSGTRHRTKGRFYHGHILQFVRQVMSAQGFFKDGEVVLRLPHDSCRMPRTIFDVPLYISLCHRIVRQLDNTRQSLQPTFVRAVSKHRCIRFAETCRSIQSGHHPLKQPQIYRIERSISRLRQGRDSIFSPRNRHEQQEDKYV